MKKQYSAVVVIDQRQIYDNPRSVIFDFGENLYAAREFVQRAEEALTRYGMPFDLNYREEVEFINED